MAIPIQSQAYNPITGVFGTGQIQVFGVSGTWTVPAGIGKVRVRMWGAGGSAGYGGNTYAGGGGGGFSIKAIYDLSGVTSVAVTVAPVATSSTGSTTLFAGTSSFGSYVSATGGAYCTPTTGINVGGSGVGGDINTTGGSGVGGITVNNGGGGGSASLFGNGGNGANNNFFTTPSTGGAGGGFGTATLASPNPGGNGFNSVGGNNIIQTAGCFITMPTSGQSQQFSIDFIGCGGGGSFQQSGVNGGGGGATFAGGTPGGGCGSMGSPVAGGAGLVIVEW